jgi:hypothetical protein
MGDLGQINNNIRQRLSQTLWNWKLCGQCTEKPACGKTDCPWSKADSCEAFWNLHDQMTQAYSPDTLGRRPAIKNHQDFLEIVQHIKARRDIPQDALRKEIFEADLAPGQKPPTTNDQNRALHVAAGLILLVDFGVLHDAANFVSGGVPPVPWREGVSVETFVEEAFPRKLVSPAIEDTLPKLMAKKLTKHAKLRIKATNDIRRHLVLDKKEKVVWIFH